MKSMDNDSDEYDLFEGFANWFDKYGLSQVIEIGGEADSIGMDKALTVIGSCDPLYVWVEGRHGFQFLVAPKGTRLNREELINQGIDHLVAVWISADPFDNDDEFEMITTGGTYLCEYCEGSEDSSDCEYCEGEPGEFIEVRNSDWRDDLIEHLSELRQRGPEDLPDSFWK
jgi:hypothetical protein